MSSNSQAVVAKKPTFTMMINSDGYKKLINKTLGDPNKAARFVAAITSAVVTTPALQECNAQSIISAGFLGEALNLSPSPQLGLYYLVPYNVKTGEQDAQGNDIYIKKAQFQLGYKGYIQLAIRSGFYKKMTVLAIKEGELVNFDPLNEEITVNLIEDEEQREATPTIGYYAMFEYLNGFKKAIYWSKAKMVSHADKYSQAFSKDATTGKYPKVSYEDFEAGKVAEKDMWKYSSFWYKDFDGMAFKTMLRQLISKWGIMSTEMQEAYSKDMGVIAEDGSASYVDNDDEEIITQNEPELEIPPVADETGEININEL